MTKYSVECAGQNSFAHLSKIFILLKTVFGFVSALNCIWR